MQTENSTAVGGDDTDYPRSWIWDDDGDLCAGTFVRFDKGRTRDYGSKPIVVLNVEDEERSIWLLQTVLYEEFRRELEDRPTHDLIPGERVVIRRLEEKTGEAGRRYRPFRVLFPDRPATSTADLFELGPKPPPSPTETDLDPDDIPF